MPTKSLYQQQANKRTKTALKLRARYDGKVRKYAAALGAALAGAADAQARINRLNALYGVDISPETLLVHELRTAGLGQALATAMSNSAPGEEVQLFNATPDGNGGAVLALEAVFGEAGPVVGSGPGGGSGPAPARYDTTLTGPNQDGQGVTLAASAGDTFAFNALAAGGAAPASMDVSVGGVPVASVAYLDRYAGQPFSFTHAGVAHPGAFGATANF